MIDPNAPTQAPGAHATHPDAASMPTQVGPYRVLEVLGQGGMGRVYLGESEVPKRKAAIKLLLGEHFSPDTLARFRREMEVLARLEHPGIARLYEAGVADISGTEQPWYAMEYMDGLPLDAYVTREKLAPRAILNLVSSIAQALHYAHQKGVIHRDIKPANILVSNDGRAKILDFGIARLSTGDISGAQTRFGQIIGTLAYMSPEQVSEASHADVRSDVYALGVMLYELLAGELPIKLSNTSLIDAIREIAQGKRRPLSHARPDLKGEVELMVETATHLDMNKRYASAESFAHDLESYLQNRPILAKRASRLYVFGKFARRNPLLVAALATAVLALGASSVYSWRAAQRAENARLLAEARNAELTAVNEFVAKMLMEADPTSASGLDMSMKKVLDNAELAFNDLKAGDNVRGAVALMLAQARRGLNDGEAALKLADQAIASLSKTRDARDAQLIYAKLQRVIALTQLGKFEESLQYADQLLPELRRSFAPHSADEIRLLSQKVVALNELDRAQEALTLSEELVENGASALQAMAGTEYASILHNHASVLASAGRLEESQAILEDVWARGLKSNQQWQPHYLYARHTQSVHLNQMGKPEEALAVMEEAIAGRRKSLGPAHPTTLISEFGRVTLLVKLKQPERALQFLNEIMPRAELAWPPGNPSLLRAKLQQANVLDALQQSDAARGMFRDLIAASEAQPVPAEFQLQIRAALAENLLRNKQVAESLTEY
jgi:eukaryotic-like serine/threonine-protein kinase